MPNPKASFSRLQYYQNCAYAYKLKYLDKQKELPRPEISTPTGEHANTRGSRVHEAADDFINGKRDDLIKELQSFRDEFASAKVIKLATPELVSTEQWWTSDKDWNPTNSEVDKDYYLVAIVDLMIFTNKEKTHARVIDFKTGKMYGNEVKHATQLQLYAVSVFTRFPELETIDAELWYVDKAKKPKVTPFTRDQAMRFQKYWDTRIAKMANDETHEAQPHEKACMFCSWGPVEHSNKWVNKDGTCSKGVDKRFR